MQIRIHERLSFCYSQNARRPQSPLPVAILFAAIKAAPRSSAWRLHVAMEVAWDIQSGLGAPVLFKPAAACHHLHASTARFHASNTRLQASTARCHASTARCMQPPTRPPCAPEDPAEGAVVLGADLPDDCVHAPAVQLLVRKDLQRDACARTAAVAVVSRGRCRVGAFGQLQAGAAQAAGEVKSRSASAGSRFKTIRLCI